MVILVFYAGTYGTYSSVSTAEVLTPANLPFLKVDGLYVLLCFDWFVIDEIIRSKSEKNYQVLFSAENIYKSAGLTVVSGSGHTRKLVKCIGRCHPYARKAALKVVLVRCSSPFKRLSQHLTLLRAWCKQCLPGR